MKPDFTPLEVAQQVSAAINSVKSSTLTEYTRSARLSPIVLIDSRLLAMDVTQIRSLEQTLLSIYTGYYLQAVNMTMNVGNVKVSRILDQFSTDRSIITAAGNSVFWSNESLNTDSVELPNYALEDVADLIPQSWAAPGYNKDGDSRLHGNKGADNDKAIHNITDESNLAVGKIIDVKFAEGDHNVTIPVVATLNPKSISPEDFLAINKANSIDKSFKARWHQWRSGEIRFFQDYLLAQDLIEANKKALLADTKGSLLSVRSKRTKGFIAALLSGYASPNAISTMVIISKQTAFDLSVILKGNLKDHHTRQAYFENTSSMMLVVVDPEMERFTIYERDIADYKEHTFEDIKGNDKKGGGVNIENVLKQFQKGSAPTF